MKYKHFSKQILTKLSTAQYWRHLNPELTISDYPFLQPPPQIDTEHIDIDRYVRQMQQEGYFKLDAVLPRNGMDKLANAIVRLVSKGFPPSFAYVYDEFWQTFRNVSPIMAPILGRNYRLSTNLWAWYIPSTGKDAGFAPHRDIINAPAIRTDGMPLMATVWIPLKDVTTLHACMYVLPLNRDPNFPNNKESTEIPPQSIQSIRALPGKAGSILSWNMDTIHWSSVSSKWANEPRISIAAYLASAEGPDITSINIKPTQILTLDFRLGVIGIMMNWFNKADLDKDNYPLQLLQFCDRYYHCEPNERRFEQPAQPRTVIHAEPSPQIMPGVSRNEPCPCGSGKKYKHCHGS